MPITEALQTEIVEYIETSANDRAAEAKAESEQEGEKNDDDSIAVGEKVGGSDSDGGESDPVHQEQEDEGGGGAGAAEEDGEEEGVGDASGGKGDSWQISEEAIVEAISAGLSIADAMALGSDEKVKGVAAALMAGVNAEVSREADEVSRADFEAAAKKRHEEFEKSLPTLDPDEHDPSLVKMVEGMKETMLRQQEQLDSFQQQSEVNSLASANAGAAELRTWFDAQASSLKAEFEGVLGEGSMEDLAIDSIKGNQIADKMGAMIAGYDAVNLTAPPREQVFAEAARLVLGKEYASMEETRLTNGIKKRSGMEISRPGGSKSKHAQTAQDETAALIDSQYFDK